MSYIMECPEASIKHYPSLFSPLMWAQEIVCVNIFVVSDPSVCWTIFSKIQKTFLLYLQLYSFNRKHRCWQLSRYLCQMIFYLNTETTLSHVNESMLWPQGPTLVESGNIFSQPEWIMTCSYYENENCYAAFTLLKYVVYLCISDDHFYYNV